MASRLEAAARVAALAPVDLAVAGWVCASDRRSEWIAVEICDATPVAFGRRGGAATDAVASTAAALVSPARTRVVAQRETAEGEALSALRRGHAVRLRVALRPDRSLSNPGASSHARTNVRRGIGARARLVDASLLARVPARDRGAALARALAWRSRIADRLLGVGPGGALLGALATGDRSGLTRAEVDAFAALGIGHLLAVSGLHLSLVAALAFAMARWGLVRIRRLSQRWDVRSASLGVALGASVTYAFLAGWGVPVQRSLVFVAVVAARFAFGRGASSAHVLALAAIVVLAADPGALFAAGAELSFVATAALLAAVESAPIGRTDRRWRRLLAGLASGARVSALAIVATAPLLAWHEMQLSSFGLVANAVAVPFTAFVLLPASLFAAVLATLPLTEVAFAAVLSPFAGVADLSLRLVGDVGARMPASDPTPVAGWAVALAVLVAAVALRTRRTTALVAMAAAVPLGLRLAPVPSPGPAPPRLVVFDVGRGDAVLLQGGRGAVLIDGGWAMPDGPDLGRTVLLPALRALGVRRLDLVVASHADLDHRGGLETIVSSLPVGELWLPWGGQAEPDFAALVAAASRRGVVVREQRAGGRERRFGDLRVAPLWPPREASAPASRNDRSLVVRVEVDGVVVLATGDIGREAEAALLAHAGADGLRAEVLKLAHHGSRSSSASAFLAAVDPVVAIASAPCGGRMGLPTSEAFDRVRAQGAAVWWTGRDGAVTVAWPGAPAGGPIVVSGREPRDRCALR